MSSSNGYLLDTNVLSETRKTRADPGVIGFLTQTHEQALLISVLTLGELRRGVAAKRRDDAAAAARLELWVDGIESMFTDRILPITAAIARQWAELPVDRTLPIIDALIAATARTHGLTLVTRNIRDVASTGADLLNPWEASSSPKSVLRP